MTAEDVMVGDGKIAVVSSAMVSSATLGAGYDVDGTMRVVRRWWCDVGSVMVGSMMHLGVNV